MGSFVCRSNVHTPSLWSGTSCLRIRVRDDAACRAGAWCGGQTRTHHPRHGAGRTRCFSHGQADLITAALSSTGRRPPSSSAADLEGHERGVGTTVETKMLGEGSPASVTRTVIVRPSPSDWLAGVTVMVRLTPAAERDAGNQRSMSMDVHVADNTRLAAGVSTSPMVNVIGPGRLFIDDSLVGETLGNRRHLVVDGRNRVEVRRGSLVPLT